MHIALKALAACFLLASGTLAGSVAALNYGTAGTGSTTHLATELFNHMAGTRMAHVPYKGIGPT